jgi:hypothetical protein
MADACWRRLKNEAATNGSPFLAMLAPPYVGLSSAWGIGSEPPKTCTEPTWSSRTCRSFFSTMSLSVEAYRASMEVAIS